MSFLRLVIALASLAGAADDPWSRSPIPETATVGRAPTARERREAFDEVSSAITAWQRERREHARDLAQRQRWLDRPTDASTPTDPPPSTKLTEVSAPSVGTSAVGRGRFIQVRPEPANWVEAEILRMEDEQAEGGARKRSAPADPATAREEQARLEAGNREWDAVVARKQAEREAAIEEEARRIQANLEAERRREAETEARRLGGKLDAEGNFVDPDLEEHK